MKFYEGICLLRYDTPRKFRVKASSKHRAEFLGKVICSSAYNEPDPQISVREIKVKDSGNKLSRANYVKGDYIGEHCFKTGSKSGMRSAFKNIVNCISISEGEIYDESLLDSKECEDIEKVVVFWKVGDTITRETYKDIDSFHNYAQENGLHYNCENSTILKDNMLVGMVYNRYKMIDYNDLKHKFKEVV